MGMTQQETETLLYLEGISATVVLREGHPLLERPHVRLRDLADAGWALPGPEVLARRRLEGRLAEHGLPLPRVVAQVDNSMTLAPALLRGSDLLAVMSRFSLACSGSSAADASPSASPAASTLRRIEHSRACIICT